MNDITIILVFYSQAPTFTFQTTYVPTKTTRQVEPLRSPKYMWSNIKRSTTIHKTNTWNTMNLDS